MGGLDGAREIPSLVYSVFELVEFSSPEKFDEQRLGTGTILFVLAARRTDACAARQQNEANAN
jgi:hypothetical protein